MTHYFLSGIGGSGMLPLAHILKGLGHCVSGSDRSRDQGRLPEKFAKLEADGFALFPQDGLGLQGEQSDLASSVCMAGAFNRPDFLVVSAAVEDTVPDVVAAKAAGIPIIKRAELLADVFNTYKRRVVIGGTSGKTTTTGMIGHIAQVAGLDPVVMCGGVMKNYGASALTGKGDLFITEADESDGTIALYHPGIAVLTNVSVDHKGLEELRALFGAFLKKADASVVNRDNEEALALASDGVRTFSVGDEEADLHAKDIEFHADGISATLVSGLDNVKCRMDLKVPGAHNLSNALAAISVARALGIKTEDACAALKTFSGIKRRMDVVGTVGDITVIDDFAHNPDKIAATLTALKQFPGRILVIFQMHGFGPLKIMGPELAKSFADHLGPDDRLFTMDPLYLGGTVDRSVGMKSVTDTIGPRASFHADRNAAGQAALAAAKPGDRIVVMGARDDTLSTFAESLLQSL